MWARRGARLWRCRLLPQSALPAEVSSREQMAHNVQPSGILRHLQSARAYSTNIWDVPNQSAHRDVYVELHIIRNMLPQPSPLTPHFNPHGIVMAPCSSSWHASAAMQQHATDVDVDVDAGEKVELSEMLADSVKRKRKMKMKKHKLRKRRKLARHSN